MEQLFFLLVFGLIALVRWLIESGKLKKIFGDFNSELNNENDGRFSNPNTPTFPRQTPPPRPSSKLSPEEERTRKFMEALGLPPDAVTPAPAPPLPPLQQSSRPSERYPVPPIVSQPLETINERAHVEKERLQRKLAEKRKVYERGLARAPQAGQRQPPAISEPVKATPVADYFKQPSTQASPDDAAGEVINVPEEIGHQDAFLIKEKKAVSPPVLDQVFGQGTDLRRLILAQEIFGKPKSLQIP